MTLTSLNIKTIFSFTLSSHSFNQLKFLHLLNQEPRLAVLYPSLSFRPKTSSPEKLSITVFIFNAVTWLIIVISGSIIGVQLSNIIFEISSANLKGFFSPIPITSFVLSSIPIKILPPVELVIQFPSFFQHAKRSHASA